jgi:hypothetical protein
MSHYSTPEDGLQGVRQEFMENCQFRLYSSGVPFHWKQKWRKTRMKCKRFIKKGKERHERLAEKGVSMYNGQSYSMDNCLHAANGTTDQRRRWLWPKRKSAS